MDKYLVLFPIDFGDGTVHYPDEIVELDSNTAKTYCDVLIRVQRDAERIGASVREIRRRLGLNTRKFGGLLGVTHAQISRYESGRALPGVFPLWRLLAIADGAEKNPFLKQLGQMLPQPLDDPTEGQLREEYERCGFPVPGLTTEGGADRWAWSAPFGPKSKPYLDALAKVVSELCDRDEEVDASLVKILRLWLSANSSDTEVRKLFADAATFIEVGLGSKNADASTRKPKKTA